MNAARIGVKYCGGCREQYDRKAAFEKIRDGFSDAGAKFVQAEDDGAYDALLVLCGCPSGCADISKYSTGRIIMVDDTDGYMTALAVLSRVLTDKG